MKNTVENTGRKQRRLHEKINKNKALEGENSLIIVSMTKRKGERNTCR